MERFTLCPVALAYALLSAAQPGPAQAAEAVARSKWAPTSAQTARSKWIPSAETVGRSKWIPFAERKRRPAWSPSAEPEVRSQWTHSAETVRSKWTPSAEPVSRSKWIPIAEPVARSKWIPLAEPVARSKWTPFAEMATLSKWLPLAENDPPKWTPLAEASVASKWVLSKEKTNRSKWVPIEEGAGAPKWIPVPEKVVRHKWIPSTFSDSSRSDSVRHLPESRSLAAKKPAPEPKPAPEQLDLFEQGLVELRAADDRIRSQPDSLAHHLDRLRLLYVLGVKEKTFLDQADAEIGATQSRFSRDPGAGNLLLAYRGAVWVVRAKHGFNLKRKLVCLKEGMPLLDAAVAAAPDHPEVRYLRLVSGYYLPFFIGRKAKVKEDFKALARILPSVGPGYPPEVFLTVAEFVMTKGNLDAASQAALKRRMEHVSGTAYPIGAQLP